MDDFEEFWALYPKRVAKKDAKRAWSRLTPEQRFAALQSLPTHVKFWNLSGQYLPHPATWLNGERWEDEIQLPRPKTQLDDWQRSQAGIEAKARELGMWPPRAGEDWHSLKARILARAA